MDAMLDAMKPALWDASWATIDMLAEMLPYAVTIMAAVIIVKTALRAFRRVAK